MHPGDVHCRAHSIGLPPLYFSYDEHGNKIEEAYFGTDGMPILANGGYARVTYRYDERGNQIEWTDFGTDGKPVPNSNGVARTVFSYDERGNKVEEAYFGKDGRSVLSKYGIARVTYRYDERGNQTETHVDEHGHVIEVECRAIVPGSVAERIGLAVGDRLLKYDGESIMSVDQLIFVVGHAVPVPIG